MLFKPKYMLQNMASLASEPRASQVSGPLGSLGSRLAGWLFGPASEPTLSLAQLASLKSLARLGSSWPAREALRAGSALCQPCSWLYYSLNIVAFRILADLKSSFLKNKKPPESIYFTVQAPTKHQDALYQTKKLSYHYSKSEEMRESRSRPSSGTFQ